MANNVPCGPSMASEASTNQVNNNDAQQLRKANSVEVGEQVVSASLVKFIYSEKATKILRNLPLTFDYSTYSQKLGEDFAKFCVLLRIYEL